MTTGSSKLAQGHAASVRTDYESHLSSSCHTSILSQKGSYRKPHNLNLCYKNKSHRHFVDHLPSNEMHSISSQIKKTTEYL